MIKKQLNIYLSLFVTILLSILLSLTFCDTKEKMYLVDPVSFSDYQSSIITYDPSRTIKTTTYENEKDDKEQNGIYGIFVGTDLIVHQTITGPKQDELLIISGSSTNMNSELVSSHSFPNYYMGDIDNYFFVNTESNFITANLQWSNSSVDLDMIIWNYTSDSQSLKVASSNNPIYTTCANVISPEETLSYMLINKKSFLITVVPKAISASSVTSTCTYNLSVAGQ